MFLARMMYWSEHKDHARAGAYQSAYHMLCYALHERDDCLGLWDWFGPAERFVEAHPDMDVWEYEEHVKEILADE